VFLYLSPDRLLVSQTLLVLRSSFLSFGLAGVCLLLFLLWRRSLLNSALTKLENFQEAKFLLLFVGVGLALRLLWITFIPTQLYADWEWYDKLAYNMSQVWRYEEDGAPTAYWPIGYPFFLATIYWIFGHSYFAVKFISVLLSMSICLFTYLAAKRIVGPLGARLSLVILALFPSQIFFTSILASEILFTAFLVLIIYLLVKRTDASSIWNPVMVGVLAGLLILVRAVALFFPLLIVFFYFKSDRSPVLVLRNAALTILVSYLTLSPWLLRNKLVMGTFTVATSGGINLYIGNSPISSGGWVWRTENPFGALTAPNEVENNRLGYRLATKFIADDPLGFVARGVKKEIYMFATDFAAIAKELDLAAKARRVDEFVIFNLVGQTYYLTVLVLSAGGFVLLLRERRKRNRGFFLLGAILAYWFAAHFVFFGTDRFHFPLVPIFCIFSSWFMLSQVSPSSQRYIEEEAPGPTGDQAG
jgi:4-amino-4-deoxy-L-arabinose transferase-like glycosyltransferase